MNNEEVRVRLETDLRKLEERDSYLFENDLSERCIAARHALHLQNLIADYSVDVECNRKGVLPKRLHLPSECGITDRRSILGIRTGTAGGRLIDKKQLEAAGQRLFPWLRHTLCANS